MKALNEMKISFPSRSANEGFARVAVSGFIAQLDPTVEELTEIKTAVSEAVTNAIVHGYEDKIGNIYIRAKTYENGLLEVVIEDRGRGIADIEQAKTPLFTTSTTGERAGMGFTIMESFMDTMKITSRVGWGTRVKLRKLIKKR